MKIAVIGTGYVGMVTAVCLADLGHTVIGTDVVPEKIDKASQGISHIYEPGLEDLLKKNLKRGNLSFLHDLDKTIRSSDVLFVSVNTPQREDGSADMVYVEGVSRRIAENLNNYKVVVEKSTVPVQTSLWIKKTIDLHKKSDVEFDVASNPEFLREGTAVQDFLHPDRIVIPISGRVKWVVGFRGCGRGRGAGCGTALLGEWWRSFGRGQEEDRDEAWGTQGGDHARRPRDGRLGARPGDGGQRERPHARGARPDHAERASLRGDGAGRRRPRRPRREPAGWPARTVRRCPDAHRHLPQKGQRQRDSTHPRPLRDRPRLPRPEFCCSARQTIPLAFPCLAISSKCALVESTSKNTSSCVKFDRACSSSPNRILS